MGLIAPHPRPSPIKGEGEGRCRHRRFRLGLARRLGALVLAGVMSFQRMVWPLITEE